MSSEMDRTNFTGILQVDILMYSTLLAKNKNGPNNIHHQFLYPNLSKYGSKFDQLTNIHIYIYQTKKSISIWIGNYSIRMYIYDYTYNPI